MIKFPYTTTLPSAAHWSLRVRQGTQLTLTDLTGDANVGMLFYNPEDLLERYNAPDTLKCQHTFKLSRGHCLYSDMGRIFASIVKDDCGWHETVCGSSFAHQIAQRWGARDYQNQSNQWHQNGHDAFLVELAKYGLKRADLAANINWFSKVTTDSRGNLSRQAEHSKAGDEISLRMEMDTLVVLHTCPHPLDQRREYPRYSVQVKLATAPPVTDDDYCLNFQPENRRGFANNALYYLGRS